MKNPFSTLAAPLDAGAIHDTIQRALASAGLDTRSGAMQGVTDTIRRSLAAAGLSGATAPTAAEGSVIDIVAREIKTGLPDPIQPTRQPPIGDAEAPGAFETHQINHPAGTRLYKVYVPSRPVQGPMPMLLMLHGCTQSADDFAAGTQMNRLAEAHGFLVVYPEQAAQANPSRCWNWFKSQDQVRDGGEPALIAGIAAAVAARHDADTRRIFVAGLSAGAAMAVILGQTYPDRVAGIGAHSGLPYGSAHDVPSALAAMKGRPGAQGNLQGLPGATPGKAKRAVQPVPTIVFHGDRDQTVKQGNGALIARQAADAHGALPGAPALKVSTQRGTAPGGRTFSRTVHADASGASRIECWTLHGAGHAWSGGSAKGSYTDGTGPDASAEMVRFFLALPRAGAA